MFEAGDELVVAKAWCSTLKDGDTALVLNTVRDARSGRIRWTSGYHVSQVMSLVLEGYFQKVQCRGPW